jgi:hypothetical protein
MSALLTVSPEAKALLKLYEKALISATYEYLHGEEVRVMCEQEGEGYADKCAEACEKQDADKMKEFENLLAAFASALLPA